MSTRRKTPDFNAIREIARSLPDVDVEESTTYGVPSLKVGGKLLACPAINKSAEPNTLVVRIDPDRRAELIEADPNVYYVTDHYMNYPSVLVRLSRIDRDALSDLLSMSIRFVTSKTKKRKRRPR